MAKTQQTSEIEKNIISFKNYQKEIKNVPNEITNYLVEIDFQEVK